MRLRVGLRRCAGSPAGCARSSGIDVAGRVLGVVGRVDLLVAVQRRAGVAAPADHVLLLGDADPVPELDEHPDQPDDLVAAAARSRPARRRARLRPRPGWSSSSASVTSGLAMPSLKPMQVARACPAGPRRAGKPSIRHRTCMPPRVCRAMSRSACSDRVRLSAHSCRLRSPWHWRGRGRRWGTAASASGCAGLRAGQAVAVVEQRGADADRDGEAVRGPPSARACRSRRAGRRCRPAAGCRRR